MDDLLLHDLIICALSEAERVLADEQLTTADASEWNARRDRLAAAQKHQAELLQALGELGVLLPGGRAGD